MNIYNVALNRAMRCASGRIKTTTWTALRVHLPLDVEIFWQSRNYKNKLHTISMWRYTWAAHHTYSSSLDFWYVICLCFISPNKQALGITSSTIRIHCHNHTKNNTTKTNVLYVLFNDIFTLRSVMPQLQWFHFRYGTNVL